MMRQSGFSLLDVRATLTDSRRIHGVIEVFGGLVTGSGLWRNVSYVAYVQLSSINDRII